jgi:hypothetical protein
MDGWMDGCRESGSDPSDWLVGIFSVQTPIVHRSSSGGGDPSDWLVPAMRENAQFSASGGMAARVGSSFWTSQFQKLLHSLPEASSFVPWGVPRCMMPVLTFWPSINADQAKKLFICMYLAPF